MNKKNTWKETQSHQSDQSRLRSDISEKMWGYGGAYGVDFTATADIRHQSDVKHKSAVINIINNGMLIYGICSCNNGDSDVSNLPQF